MSISWKYIDLHRLLQDVFRSVGGAAPGHSPWRTITTLTTIKSDSFENEYSFLDGISFRASLGQHPVYIHRHYNRTPTLATYFPSISSANNSRTLSLAASSASRPAAVARYTFRRDLPLRCVVERR